MTNVSELLPKKHINADAFAESNPTADGSTTVIAIWDTGVDPTAGGLQIPTHWKPKNGEIRMGVKLASELFPRALLQRLRNENKDDVWSPCVKKLASHIAGDFSDAEEQLTESYESRWRTLGLDTHPGPVNQENQHTVSSETRSTQNLTVKDDTEDLDWVPNPARRTCGRRKSMPKGKLNESEATGSPLSTSKDQLKSAARLLEDALVTFDRHYVAPEMVYDCFVFHDGAQWL
ncbi:hypothetical protein FGIG_01833 [Fasciola gigantica]|uniref:Peptidase S8/S53 domain-containing protein n=1 Tax=Fasciola gigantica TaxID=46835 RepID=A0A504Z949_FASGI|nr:hypothetical protein FGIG_01833 [Fasciola gigantica]